MINCVVCGRLTKSMSLWLSHSCAKRSAEKYPTHHFSLLLEDQLEDNHARFHIKSLSKTEIARYAKICRTATNLRNSKSDEWFIETLLATSDQNLAKRWIDFLQYYPSAKKAIASYEEMISTGSRNRKYQSYPFGGIYLGQPTEWYD